MAWQDDYATLDELKSYTGITDAVDNDELTLAITAASRAIDHATNRQFAVTAATEERTYEVKWSRRRGLYVANIDDVQTLTGLVVTVAGATTTDYVLTPTNAAAKGVPWETMGTLSATTPTLGTGPRTILVEATWGWTAVPDTIKQATLVQSSRVFKRRDAPFGIAGSPDVGSELRLLAKVDPDVEVMIRPYRRDWPFL